MQALIIACSLTEETVELVNDAFFQHLKPGVTLVNIACGKIVDGMALIGALKRGIVSQAFAMSLIPNPYRSTDRCGIWKPC